MVNVKLASKIGANGNSKNVSESWDATKINIETVHKKFVEYGSNAKEWMRKCVLLLPEINRSEVWKKKGFLSIYEYAAKLAGMSRENVNEGLRILERIGDKPALMAVVEEKGLWAVKPIANIVTKKTEAFWAGKARELSRHELEVYVRGLKIQSESVVSGEGGSVAGDLVGGLGYGAIEELGRTGTVTDYGKLTGSGDSGDFSNGCGRCVSVSMELESDVLDFLKKLKGDGDWNTLMKEFLALREEKFEREKLEIKGAGGGVAAGGTSRHVPAKIKRFVLAKYNLRCAFPGCNRRYAELHHTERFFFGGGHDPDRIIPLCEAHHGLAHRGLIENENLEPSKWRIMAEVGFDCLNCADRMVMAHRR